MPIGPKTLLAGLFCLIATAAFAQQQPPSPVEQACNYKLSAEINSGLQYSAALITVRGDLAKAQARVKELEDKYEPKKPDEKK